MKNMVAILFSLLLSINTCFALTSHEIPDELYVTERWVSLTTTYDIEAKTQKFGTLYRKFLSFLLTYEFFDPAGNKLAYARSRFWSITAHFDLYDTDDHFLGSADEKLFSLFPAFDIYDTDNSTKLAKATMNVWGTTFTIADPISGKEMATLHRSFIRFKNNWTFTITNRELFDQKGIDTKVLMTVIAFQGDREYWESKNNNSYKTVTKALAQSNEVTPEQVTTLLDEVTAVKNKAGLDTLENPEPAVLETVANELEANYKTTQVSDESTQTNLEKLSSFVNYCLSIVQSQTTDVDKKKVILYLLQMRLESGRI